jgi:hypothetical protein
MKRIPASADEASGFGFEMPAPVGGWNARDALAKMKPTDAVRLDNFFPGTGTVDSRPGYTVEATLPGGHDVQTLMACAKSDGTIKRFAATAQGIYDITAGGTIAAVDEACTIGKWEWLQINVSNVPWLWCCAGDGVNKAKAYNASTDTWVQLGSLSTPALTGVTSENVSNVSMWKYRLILCCKDSLSVWYGPLNSVGGAFTEFPLGAIFKKGGYIVACANWTLDAGAGIDDHFVVITSEGEVAVYSGTDPSSATGFSLVGVYAIGKPIGKRCFEQAAGDLAVLTEAGLWPLSKALLTATMDRKQSLSDKIAGAFTSYYKQFGTEFGWQQVLLPKGPALLVNVPLGLKRSYQFVMNVTTGAWTRFTNWNATCMMVVGGELYFAADNIVKKGWTGTKDGSGTIPLAAQTAFSYGPARARSKQITLVKPVIQTTSAIQLGLALDTDFNIRRSLSSAASSVTELPLFDIGLYDDAIWAGGSSLSNKWRAVRHNPGAAFSLRLAASIKDISISWASTDFIGEAGDLLR